MYKPEAGVVTLADEQVIKSVTLQPRFGYMEIFSLPEQDADVYTLTAVLVGKTPLPAATVWLSRTYRVRIEKELYFPVDTVLTVTAGETVRPTFHLESTIKPRVPHQHAGTALRRLQSQRHFLRCHAGLWAQERCLRGLPQRTSLR